MEARREAGRTVADGDDARMMRGVIRLVPSFSVPATAVKKGA
jgi:hypothetical protein